MRLERQFEAAQRKETRRDAGDEQDPQAQLARRGLSPIVVVVPAEVLERLRAERRKAEQRRQVVEGSILEAHS
jgi:hypothetical protein